MTVRKDSHVSTLQLPCCGAAFVLSLSALVVKKTKTVMLVEDHVDTREAYAEFLRLEGFEVSEFGDAESALAVLHGELPDVLVIDHTLPSMDGLEAARRLRQEPRTAEFPIVFLTGHSNLDGHAEVRAEILRKPTAPEDLVAVLKRILATSL